MKEIVRRLRRYEVIDDHTLNELIETSPPPWADDKWVTFYFRGDADEVRLQRPQGAFLAQAGQGV